MRNIFSSILIVGLAALLFAGCGEKVVREFEDAKERLAEDPGALDGVFHGDITFCRRVGKKTGRPIGVATEFEMGEKNSVHGLVSFKNAEPGKLYAVHLVWLDPEEHEIFRKYAEVRVEETESGFRSRTQWRKAEDLHYLREKTRKHSEPEFDLDISLRTYQPARDENGERIRVPREPGDYTLRVYMHRDLMLEESVSLTN